ncbi:MAG: response regulator, partial [Psychrosphaera sp.]|nr:response regulator [Psychrosphaera sp.]
MTDNSNNPNEKTVLIVDDVDYSRQLLRNAILSVANNEKLKTKRFKFVNASNGTDTIAKIEQHKPDLIFLDIELPDINGIEVLKRIKSKDPKSFVIMVSGESTIENVKGSLTNGPAGFIV